MASLRKISPATDGSILLVAPDQADDQLLSRAAAASAMVGGDLQAYCPVVLPPTPHSWMTREMPPAVGQLGPARERGRRLACQVQAALNQKEIDACVETGICQSATSAILNAVERFRPRLLMYAKPRGTEGLVNQPYIVQHDALLSRLNVPIWIVHPGELRGDSIVGLVAAASKPGFRRDRDRRVGSAVARLAALSRSEGHLVACERRAPALAIVREVMAPSDARVEQFRNLALAGHLSDLASDCGIADGHTHLRKGGPDGVLDEIVDTLNVGLVVTADAQRQRLGGLWKSHEATRLIDLPCDLLVLCESEFPFE